MMFSVSSRAIPVRRLPWSRRSRCRPGPPCRPGRSPRRRWAAFRFQGSSGLEPWQMRTISSSPAPRVFDNNERSSRRHQAARALVLVIDPVGFDGQELVPRHRRQPSGSPPHCQSPGPGTSRAPPISFTSMMLDRISEGLRPERPPRFPRWSARSRPATRDPAAETRRSGGPPAFRTGSSSMPNQLRLSQTPERIRAEFSPIPPVNAIHRPRPIRAGTRQGNDGSRR